MEGRTWEETEQDLWGNRQVERTGYLDDQHKMEASDEVGEIGLSK